MYLQVAAVASAGASPVVRVAAAEPWLLKRALDCGAHGVMVPMVESVAQAKAVAAACRYPPAGVRGAGAMFAPAAFGQTGREYLLSANANVVVMVQIESRAAVEVVEEIAGVEGVDALFVGPNDLASSMGYVAFDHASIPEVQEATARVLAAGKKAGKFVGHFALGAEAAAEKWRQGWEFMNCGADIVAVEAWMTKEMARFKELVAEKKEKDEERR
jgi:4-hydroxy-2-oxoheptanedioate aldolase